MDRSGIPYSNGFSGTVERRFNPATYRLALAEQLDITSRRWAAVDGFVHFCKLHGSVNWIEENAGLYPIRELDIIGSLFDHGTHVVELLESQFAEGGASNSELLKAFQQRTKISKSTFDRTLRELKTSNRIRVEGTKTRPRYFPVEGTATKNPSDG